MGSHNQTATTAATNAGNLSSGLEGNASSIYSTLAPQLQAEAAHPSGMSPTDLAAIDTATKQTAGGTQAGATGQGALLAARTRNAGGADAAIANAARSGGEQQSQATLDTQMANEKLKEHQQQAGLTGLEGLYGENLSGGLQSAGQIAPDVNADTNAYNASWSWAKDILDPLLAGGATVATARMKGCWIAEAIYGKYDTRTALARAWLNGPFCDGWLGRATMWLYGKIGRKVAAIVGHSPWLQSALKPLFDIAVRRAHE